MLLRSAVAKAAMPFPLNTVHDHWLCIVAAGCGRIGFCRDRLVRYRQHRGNQTGVLAGITTKKDYRIRKLQPLAERFAFYTEYFTPSEQMERFIWGRLNQEFFTVWRYRAFSPYEAALELAMRIIPEGLFEILMRKLK